MARTIVDKAAQVAALLQASLPASRRPLLQVTLVCEPYHAIRSLRIFATTWGQAPTARPLRLAVTTRVPSTALSGQSAASLELVHCIDEKRKMMLGW